MSNIGKGKNYSLEERQAILNKYNNLMSEEGLTQVEASKKVKVHLTSIRRWQGQGLSKKDDSPEIVFHQPKVKRRYTKCKKEETFKNELANDNKLIVVLGDFVSVNKLLSSYL